MKQHKNGQVNRLELPEGEAQARQAEAMQQVAAIKMAAQFRGTVAKGAIDLAAAAVASGAYSLDSETLVDDALALSRKIAVRGYGVKPITEEEYHAVAGGPVEPQE